MSVDPSRCPVCGAPNRCALVEGGGRCWCSEVSIPRDALEKIPLEARGVACLCRACATGRRDPEQTHRIIQRLLRRR